jgi:multisubunit Na+/H+ antiporter MnhG subunit
MLERFGRLCGWTGTGIAILLIGAALLLPITSGGDRGDYIFSRVLFLVLPGVAAFLIGQAIRYFLVPPKKSNPLP